MKIVLVAGARPNFVKIAPLMTALQEYDAVSTMLIHTGQHYDSLLSNAFFQDLGIPEPAVNLGVRVDSNALQTAEIMLRLVPVFAAAHPDLVLVVGDVNSTAAAALVAAKMGLRVAHVEAGLRSFDRQMPEELNRVVTDAVSDLCFTTEPTANDNLRREGVAAERIHHVGNVMVDTLFRFRESAASSTILGALGLRPREFAVLTLHRPSNVDDPRDLRRTLAAIESIQRDLPMVFPVHPRTRQRLDDVLRDLDQWHGLRCVSPLPYFDFMHLMASAVCVLTDSGGIQEETTALQIPCLTLRTTTERPITVTQGTNRIVGFAADRVQRAWADIRRGDWPKGRLPELWDGKAAERIARVLVA